MLPKSISFFKIIVIFFLLFEGSIAFAQQEIIRIKGTVIDAETKEALPFANVTFVGTTIGITTDFDGNYSLESQWGTDSIQVSYLGYETKKIKITKERRQTIDFELYSEAATLVTAVVTEKKGRYRKRNNPAVDLIRKVIKNKKNNRLEANDYYQYNCLLYTSPSPRDATLSRMPSSA